MKRATGLGKPEKDVLDNNIKIRKNKLFDEFLDSVLKNFKIIAKYNGFSYHYEKKGFKFGIEAPYKYDDTQIIYIDFDDIGESYIEEGRAWGCYGSDCLTRRRYFKDYVRRSKFVRFVEEWQLKLKKYFDRREKREAIR